MKPKGKMVYKTNYLECLTGGVWLFPIFWNYFFFTIIITKGRHKKKKTQQQQNTLFQYNQIVVIFFFYYFSYSPRLLSNQAVELLCKQLFKDFL